MHTHPGSTCLALVPSFHHCFCLRRIGGGGAVQDAQALEEVASSITCPLVSLPAAWMGTIIALEGQGRSQNCNQVRDPEREGLPLFIPQGTLAGAWTTLESCPKVSLLSSEGVLGWGEALPCPPAGSGTPLQAARRPKGRVGSRLCPSCLLAGVQIQSQDKKILW